MPELDKYASSGKRILVATKCDLRDDAAALEKLVSSEEAIALATRLKFEAYVETTAMVKIRARNCFEVAACIFAGSFGVEELPSSKSRSKCILA